MKSNMYKNRWLNALKQLAKLNRIIKQGYRVTYDTNKVTKFIIVKNCGISKLGYKVGNSFFMLGDNDMDADNGIMYDSIDDFNSDLEKRVAICKEIKISEM